ncbi:hypothetical protein GCM10010298_11440 [Streptomyces microflavus]|nr:hypothetical protein GCM10010298_11440 [Streptomyces microflavus]
MSSFAALGAFGAFAALLAAFDAVEALGVSGVVPDFDDVTADLLADFRTGFPGPPGEPFAALSGRTGECSPTAESRCSDTPSAPSACALPGILDTRPA